MMEAPLSARIAWVARTKAQRSASLPRRDLRLQVMVISLPHTVVTKGPLLFLESSRSTLDFTNSRLSIAWRQSSNHRKSSFLVKDELNWWRMYIMSANGQLINTDYILDKYRMQNINVDTTALISPKLQIRWWNTMFTLIRQWNWMPYGLSADRRNHSVLRDLLSIKGPIAKKNRFLFLSWWVGRLFCFLWDWD